MLLSLEWLSEYLDLGGRTPAELAEILTLHVAEVEDVVSPAVDGVVVGHVLSVRPHPDADRLRLVTVDPGAEPVEVVCGAPNVAEGQKILFGGVGVVLPGGLKLERRKIRGVVSTGMVLSERELGLGDDHDGIVVLPPESRTGAPMAEVMADRVAIEIGNTGISTRPDLWGHYGMARDLAAVLDTVLRPLDLGDAPALLEAAGDPQVEVEIQDAELCPRYLGWVLGGIRVGPSPAWLQRRLEAAGQRPINNVVDLTNYILLECGQPLHAFDRRQIEGDRILVRPAAAGETVTTLDGAERRLPEGACVIADPTRAVAIGGVMGLENSEVREDTTEIILEVANFKMQSIRATSGALQLRTESAVRFEKGLDPEGVPVAALRFVKLLKDLCPELKVLGKPRDAYPRRPETRRIAFDPALVGRRLGTPVAAETARSILERLGFNVEEKEGAWEVAVPSWRAGEDVSIPEDLVEEVGRVHGYGRIEPTPLRGALEPVPRESVRRTRRELRRTLSGRAGLTEIYTYPFVTAEACRKCEIEPGAYAVRDAEQAGLDLMAPSLLPNLLDATGRNLRFREAVGLYVVAPAFAPVSEGLPTQEERLAFTVTPYGTEEAALTAKSVVELVLEAFRLRGVRLEQAEGPGWLHPGRCARVARGRDEFGWFGQLHPRVADRWEIGVPVGVAELDLARLGGAKSTPLKFHAVSRFPNARFDVSVIVDRKVPAGTVADVLRKSGRERTRRVDLFDIYEGSPIPEGSKSLTYALEFGSDEGTLDGAEVERLRAAVQEAVQRRGWELRR